MPHTTWFSLCGGLENLSGPPAYFFLLCARGHGVESRSDGSLRRMPLPFWRRNKPKVAFTVAEDRPPLKIGQFYCEKCGRATYFDLHRPFCSAECKFNLTGTANYLGDPKPRGRRRDEQKHFYFHVHGVMHGNRQSVVSCCVRGEDICLIREPTNPFDRYAIRVLRLNGDDLGYVPRDIAAELAPMMDAGQQVRAEVDWLNSPTPEPRHYGLKVRVGLLKGNSG